MPTPMVQRPRSLLTRPSDSLDADVAYKTVSRDKATAFMAARLRNCSTDEREKLRAAARLVLVLRSVEGSIIDALAACENDAEGDDEPDLVYDLRLVANLAYYIEHHADMIQDCIPGATLLGVGPVLDLLEEDVLPDAVAV